jgi:hypothetical protein
VQRRQEDHLPKENCTVEIIGMENVKAQEEMDRSELSRKQISPTARSKIETSESDRDKKHKC